MSHVNDKNSSVFKIALNLTLASLISGAIIASVYFVTQPFAAEERVNQKKQALKELVDSADQFKPVSGKEDWYLAEKNGTPIAYIIPAEGRGYGGSIKIMLAADLQGRIIDYKILFHNETPGLGDIAALPKFRKQFAGKKMENMEVVKRHEEGKIDAISGATITSRAVTHALKEALQSLDELISGKSSEKKTDKAYGKGSHDAVSGATKKQESKNEKK